MSLLSKLRGESRVELDTEVTRHESFETRLQEAVDSAEAMLRRVRMDAATQAEALKARADLYLSQHASLLDKFTGGGK